ncbi:MAG: hypothetical protein HOO96_03155 [Polyangiaceae bacterium]|nr:hypothetical protein [Polyangiaceae bacterium]
MSLVLCSSCRRHARGATCVFCGAALSSPVPPMGGVANLSRAAMLMVAVAACDRQGAAADGGTRIDIPAPPYGVAPYEPATAPPIVAPYDAGTPLPHATAKGKQKG